MITTKLYLDIRGISNEDAAPLKVCVTKQGRTAYIGLGIRLSKNQWDARKQKVINAPNSRIVQSFIDNKKIQIDNAILELSSKGELTKMTSTQIKNKIIEYLDPEVSTKDLFLNRYRQYMESRTAPRTREIYATTLKKIKDFDKDSENMSFEQISKDWLTKFDHFLSSQGLVKNSRNIHFRNIRAVINDAIDNEITTHYPMRKFDINPEETAKRSLTVEELQTLFSLEVPKWQQRYLDYFKLTFYLIGINPVDLCSCTHENVVNGRLVYQRHKTGKLYSIKIEPEAWNIINKYRGNKLLVNFTEGMTNYKTFLSRANKAYKKMGCIEKVPVKVRRYRNHPYDIVYKPLFPHLSIYWARHTWATIAYSIGISDEMIAASLGHSHGNRTTAIYIDKRVADIDNANRKVLDYINESTM